MTRQPLAAVDESVIYDPMALVERASGIHVWLENQSEPYVDLIMAYSSANFGHANPAVRAIVHEAIDQIDNVVAFNSRDTLELSRKLVGLLPHSGEHQVYYPVGGAKAVDAAIKLVRGATGRPRVISFEGGFHGYSYGAMLVTDPRFVDGKRYGPLPGRVDRFPFPDRLEDVSGDHARRILHDIDRFLTTEADSVGGCIFEPIQGAAGFVNPTDGFLEGLEAICRRHGVRTICDEIQMGVGRAGTFYAHEQFGIDPDVILLGKSLAGGYYPLSAVIARSELFERLECQGIGFDSTFSNNQFATRVANGVIDFLCDNRLLEQVRRLGHAFEAQLAPLWSSSVVAGASRVGLAFGFRLADPLDTRASRVIARTLRSRAFDEHLIIQTAGANGDRIKLAPSFFMTTDQMADVAVRLGDLAEDVAGVVALR